MKKLMDDGWSFTKLPCGSEITDLHDAVWQDVDLPHDWLIWQEDLYESADAWYRRTLVPDESEQGTSLIRFDGVYMDCDIILNGETVCSHAYGYTSFDADLTGHLRPGMNELLVHIRHLSPNSRWYSGSGIYRNVYYISLPEKHIVPDSLYVAAERSENSWRIKVSAEVTGDGLFCCRLTDPEGNPVAEGKTMSDSGIASVQLLADNIRPWSPEDPALYTLEYRFGRQTERCRTGLRTIAFNSDTGFYLNGRHVKLRGVCLHHDLGALGAAFHKKAARRQLLLMKEMGANAIRTSHNPPAPELLDLCDEIGLLVVDEAFDMWERSKTQYDYARFFHDHEERDVARWVRRDRCHACVILWSIGNEIYDMHADMEGTAITRRLTEQVRLHDPLRHAEVTFGCNYMPWEGGQQCADIVKIPGYNYGETLYRKHHAEHPDWIIYGSETASLLSSRGVYHFPLERTILEESDLQCSALGNSRTGWGAQNMRHCIVDDLNTAFSLGQFLWSGIDYLGEPTPYQTRSSYFGQADTACFPKDSYYQIRSLWTDDPMIHIGVNWDWNEGQMIDVPVMSNTYEAELILNDVSIGRKRIDRRDPERCAAYWKIPFRKGVLTAVGYDRTGVEICRTERRTSGDTERITLEAEDEQLLGDGEDLAFVHVSAEDRDGHAVENARDRVHIHIAGGAYLIGTDNGDPSDTDGYKSPDRRLFSGKLLIVLRSDSSDNDVTVRAVSTAGICAELHIPVAHAEKKDGISCGQRCGLPALKNEIPVRRVELLTEGERRLTPEHPECIFTWKKYPANADCGKICWEIVNQAGVRSGCAALEIGKDTVTVRGTADGEAFLRALYGNAWDHYELISQTEISVKGFGRPLSDPYSYVSAGLYIDSEGDIIAGNEKGIAFARTGISFIGFGNLSFGTVGSDTILLDVFTAGGVPCEIRIYTEKPDVGVNPFAVIQIDVSSAWNEYRSERRTLPARLTGNHDLYFETDNCLQLRGFRFER